MRAQRTCWKRLKRWPCLAPYSHSYSHTHTLWHEDIETREPLGRESPEQWRFLTWLSAAHVIPGRTPKHVHYAKRDARPKVGFAFRHRCRKIRFERSPREPKTLHTHMSLAKILPHPLYGYQAVAVVVIGSLLASHTLLGLSIVTRLGETRLEPITITVGATVISDTLSLIVFAVCLSIFQTGFSVRAQGFQLVEISVAVPLIAVGVSRLGAWLLRKVEGDENAYFVIMLAMLVIAGSIAASINLPDIVGRSLRDLRLMRRQGMNLRKRSWSSLGVPYSSLCSSLTPAF